MRSRAPLKLLGKIVSRTPELIPTIVLGLYHKHVRSDWDYYRADGRASGPPAMITLRLTNACNHQCAICGQRGSRGYTKCDPNDGAATLPVESYMRLIDSVASARPVINITGGEPFLYSGLIELVRYIKQQGLIVYVTTNGVRLAETAAEIVSAQWDVVLVSLDGPEQVHDACRGVSGAFRAAHSGIAELLRQRRLQCRAKPYVNTSTTLSSTNVEHLEATFEIGRELEPDLMVLFLSWFTSEAIGIQQSDILRAELGIEAYTWKSYAREFTAEQAQEFQRAIVALKQRTWPFNYLIVPDVGEASYARYFLEPENRFGFGKCVAPFLTTDVLPNGDVVTCRDYIDVKVGNILHEPLLAIWNGKAYMDYRKMMIRHGGALPQCSRCCGLMGF